MNNNYTFSKQNECCEKLKNFLSDDKQLLIKFRYKREFKEKRDVQFHIVLSWLGLKKKKRETPLTSRSIPSIIVTFTILSQDFIQTMKSWIMIFPINMFVGYLLKFPKLFPRQILISIVPSTYLLYELVIIK